MGLEEVREWQRPCENKRDVVDVGQKSQKSCTTAAANGAIFIYMNEEAHKSPGGGDAAAAAETKVSWFVFGDHETNSRDHCGWRRTRYENWQEATPGTTGAAGNWHGTGMGWNWTADGELGLSGYWISLSFRFGGHYRLTGRQRGSQPPSRGFNWII